jgi:hypothetical protein
MEPTMRSLVQLFIAVILLGSLTVQYSPAQTTSVPCDLGCSISWTPPTEYEDGAPLLEQELDYYTLYCNDIYLLDLDVIIGTWTADITFGAPGTYVCALTVTSLKGGESQPSNERVFLKGERVPLPPTLL